MMLRTNASIATITVHLVFKGAAANELAHNRGGWNLLVADGDEEAQELQQAVSLGILRTVLGY